MYGFFMEEALWLIILIVWTILCIVLFVKIWKMTNDVRKIKNKYFTGVEHEDLRICRIQKEIYKKNPNISDILFDSLYANMERLYFYADYDYYGYKKLVESYEPLYEMAEIPIPWIFTQIQNRDDFRKYFINTK